MSNDVTVQVYATEHATYSFIRYLICTEFTSFSIVFVLVAVAVVVGVVVVSSGTGVGLGVVGGLGV